MLITFEAPESKRGYPFLKSVQCLGVCKEEKGVSIVESVLSSICLWECGFFLAKAILGRTNEFVGRVFQVHLLRLVRK